jgi:hypothetical protein
VLVDVVKEKHSKVISVYNADDPFSRPVLSRLVNMNDYEHRDFSYIADWVEKNLRPAR